MENIIDKLQSLQVGGDDYVYLNYEESTSVWHISDDYIGGALTETNTAQVLARLLVTPGIRVFSRYEENILELMRDEGLLDGYEKDGTFEQYLVETIQKEAYEYDLLTISTERHDHKRGTCEIAANVKVFASELFKLGEGASSFVAGFDVVIQTKNGILTLA
jgi:hypothetical protein